MKNIMTIVTLCCASSVHAAQSEWITEGPRLSEVRDFLMAQAEAWDARWPAALEFAVEYETTVSSMRWEGVLAGARLDARFVMNSIDGPAGTSGENAEGLARWLRCSGSEWIEVVPHGSGDPTKPWHATIAAECPTPFWNYAILSSAREPITGFDLPRFLDEFEILRLREDERGIDIDFIVAGPVANAIRDGRFDNVGGFVGVRARFERECSWRPVEFLDIHRYPSTFELGQLERLQTIDVGEMEGRIYRRRAWSEFIDVGGLALPGSYTMESWVTSDVTGAYVEQHYKERHSLRAKALEAPPPDSTFAIEPPAVAGPLGKISNTITGEVTIVDSRGLNERMRSQDTFVRRAIAESSGAPVATRVDIRKIGAYACLLASAVLGGLFAARTTSRRVKA